MLKQRPKTAKIQAEISPYRFKMADHERERKEGAHVSNNAGGPVTVPGFPDFFQHGGCGCIRNITGDKTGFSPWEELS